MSKILILFAHPAFQRSRINRHLLAAVKDIPGVTLNDLYEQYPDLLIDVKREQDLLKDHDIIIMHHPFYWYSTPPILKEWQDIVLQHGWAYGREGRALAGKLMFNTVTTGGPEGAYSEGGYNHFTLRQLLAPLEQTATLCRMIYLPPFAVHGTHLLESVTLQQHASGYSRLLQALVLDQVDLDLARQQIRLNSDLDAIIKDSRHVR